MISLPALNLVNVQTVSFNDIHILNQKKVYNAKVMQIPCENVVSKIFSTAFE